MYKMKKIVESGPNWGAKIYELTHAIENGESSSDGGDDLNKKDENDFFGPSNHYFRHLKTKAGRS